MVRCGSPIYYSVLTNSPLGLVLGDFVVLVENVETRLIT